MKSIITKLAIIALIGAFIIALSSCTDNGKNEEGSGEPDYGTVYYPPGQEPVERPTPTTSTEAETDFGTVYYPPGQEPVERPHPQG